MTKLTHADLQWCLLRCPKFILEILKKYPGQVYIAGGFIRAAIAREEIADVDIFVPSVEVADRLAKEFLTDEKGFKIEGARPYKTDNAITILGRGKLTPQIVHRWTFDRPEDCVHSFDFTVACAAFWWAEDREVHDGYARQPAGWQSLCDERFYPDLAAKRLIYRQPIRNEDAGGSMLRVLKFYQKGYRIPVDSLGAVIARLCRGVRAEHGWTLDDTFRNESKLGEILTGLLHEVDPAIDPKHVAHLPAENSKL